MSEISRFRKNIKGVSFGMIGLMTDAAVKAHWDCFSNAEAAKTNGEKRYWKREGKYYEKIILVITNEKIRRGVK